MHDEIALLVGHIWEMARATEPDLTGLGRVQICEQNVERLVAMAVASERERCAALADGAADAILGHANHGYSDCPWELARDIARAVRGGAS